MFPPILQLTEAHASFIDSCLNLFMIFGPILPFLPQIRLILKNHSIGNFSILTCFILINANILRILFW